MRPPTKSETFILLMIASAASAFLIPRPWTDWLRGPFQATAFLQWPATSAAREADRVVDDALARRLSAEASRRLRAENEALQRQVVNLQLQLADLAEEVELVTGLRDQLPDSHVVIVLAPVIAYDADPRRETLQILLKPWTRPLVRKGQWVAAGVYESPTRVGLARQWLIGQVTEVQTRLARVRLATDPAFRTEVRVAVPATGGGWEMTEEGCVLDGKGDGRMLISQAPVDYFAEGYRVVVVPPGPALPFPLTVARLEGSRPRDDAPTHFDLEAVPWSSAERLTHVYVIASEP
jgi:cell shape-determining protein MreC